MSAKSWLHAWKRICSSHRQAFHSHIHTPKHPLHTSPSSGAIIFLRPPHNCSSHLPTPSSGPPVKRGFAGDGGGRILATLPRQQPLRPPADPLAARCTDGHVRKAFPRYPAKAVCGQLPAREWAALQARVWVVPKSKCPDPPVKGNGILAGQGIQLALSMQAEAARTGHTRVQPRRPRQKQPAPPSSSSKTSPLFSLPLSLATCTCTSDMYGLTEPSLI